MTCIIHDKVTPAGNVGGLIYVWERWAMLARGLRHLKQYATLIPRLLFQLKEDLPPALRTAAKL